jgi:DNA polymerase-1
LREFIFDIEADHLLDDVTKIWCIVLREGDNVHSFEPHEIEQGIELMSKADKLIGHNIIGYDLPVLKKLYDFEFTGEVFDTLVVSRTIWPNLGELDSKAKQLSTRLWGSHSLGAWGHRLKVLKGDFNQGTESFAEYSPEMLEYCIQDTKVTEALYLKELEKDFSQDALDLEHTIATLMFKQEQQGFVFDESSATDLFSKLAQRKNEIELDLQETFEPTIVELKTKTKVIPFNPSSRQQIADRLMKRGWKPKDHTPSGEPKVDEKVLEGINMPEAKLLTEYLMLNKRLGQLATGKQAWLKLVKDGKLHGRVNHMGAVTSRCTHSNPNMAQVPSISAPFGAECRRLFTVPRGYNLVGADASGLELRCLAHYMGLYDSGAYAREVLEGDIHTANQEAAGLPTRNNAKTFIYGFLYGAGDAKIGSIIGKGAKEGKVIKNKFLNKTPALKKLREAVTHKAQTGAIRGLDGRRIPVRHEHAALNTLLQSAGAIICKRWYATIEDMFRKQGYTEEDIAIVAFIHDEVQIQVREGLEEKVGEITQRAMRETEQYYKFRCRLDADYNVGRTWEATH